MKLALTATATVVALGLASGSASAQYPAVVPHHGHYHVVPTYVPPPVVRGYAYPVYSPGVTFGGFYSSPGLGVGGFYSSNPGFYTPFPGYGGYGWHHHNHGHHHR